MYQNYPSKHVIRVCNSTIVFSSYRRAQYIYIECGEQTSYTVSLSRRDYKIGKLNMTLIARYRYRDSRSISYLPPLRQGALISMA